MSDDRYSMDTPDSIKMKVKAVADFLITSKLANGRTALDVGGADGYLASLIPNCLVVDPYPVPEDQMHIVPMAFNECTIYEVDELFELIVYNHVLEHIKRDYDEIEQAATRLVPGGYLFIAVPSSDSENTEWLSGVEPHVHIYDPNTLKRIARHAGLKVVSAVFMELEKGRREIWMTARRPLDDDELVSNK